MVVALGLAVAALLTAWPARADAIDGDWCSPDGRHLTIKGQSVKTPGGAMLSGNYNRHAFSYVAPEQEPGGGGTVYLSLVDETTVQVRDGTPMAHPRIWKRCDRLS
jgi:hypothetical protein